MYNYSDPNFNVILSTPARTGSTVIRTVLAEIAKVTPKIRRHHENIERMGPKEILHSHNADDVFLHNESTMHIVSTRNLIDSTYSNIIGVQTGIWRYFYRIGNITPFVVDPEQFLRKYNSKILFFNRLKEILPENYLKIDYDEYNNNMENLFNILKLNKLYYRMSRSKLPVKTIGTYRDWIINFDELQEIAKNLDPHPPI